MPDGLLSYPVLFVGVGENRDAERGHPGFILRILRVTDKRKIINSDTGDRENTLFESERFRELGEGRRNFGRRCSSMNEYIHIY